MRKSYLSVAVAFLLLVMSTVSEAAFTQTADIYQYSVGGTINWSHTYDFSQVAPLTAQLAIVADDVDLGELDQVFLNGTSLGYLAQLSDYTNWGYTPGAGGDLTTTVFALDPSLLDWTMPIEVAVGTAWGVEIETSTLTVTGAPVPEPSTLLLLGFGLASAAVWKKRQRK